MPAQIHLLLNRIPDPRSLQRVDTERKQVHDFVQFGRLDVTDGLGNSLENILL